MDNTQWYMREDFLPEMIDVKRMGLVFIKELQKLGTVFATRVECLCFCNSIRKHLGLPEITVSNTCKSLQSTQRQTHNNLCHLQIDLSPGADCVLQVQMKNHSCMLRQHTSKNAHDPADAKTQENRSETIEITLSHSYS